MATGQREPVVSGCRRGHGGNDAEVRISSVGGVVVVSGVMVGRLGDLPPAGLLAGPTEVEDKLICIGNRYRLGYLQPFPTKAGRPRQAGRPHSRRDENRR